MAKWMVNGYEVGGTVNTASAITCLDKDGSVSNVQAELDKAGKGVDHLESESTDMWLTANQGRVLNCKLTAEDGTSFQFAVNAEGKYGYIVTESEGADTFYPFSGYGATATASLITEGYTAWVNGELVVGTRPAPLTMLSGELSFGDISRNDSLSQAVEFESEFDKIPTIDTTLNCYFTTGDGTQQSTGAGAYVTVSNKSRTGFTVTVTNNSYYNLIAKGITVAWTAYV